MHFFYYEQDQANGKKNLVENLIYKQLAITLTFNLEPSFKINVHTSPISFICVKNDPDRERGEYI